MKAAHYSVRDDQHRWLREQAFKQNTTASALVRWAVAEAQARVEQGLDLGKALKEPEARR